MRQPNASDTTERLLDYLRDSLSRGLPKEKPLAHPFPSPQNAPPNVTPCSTRVSAQYRLRHGGLLLDPPSFASLGGGLTRPFAVLASVDCALTAQVQ